MVKNPVFNWEHKAINEKINGTANISYFSLETGKTGVLDYSLYNKESISRVKLRNVSGPKETWDKWLWCLPISRQKPVLSSRLTQCLWLLLVLLTLRPTVNCCKPCAHPPQLLITTQQSTFAWF